MSAEWRRNGGRVDSQCGPTRRGFGPRRPARGEGKSARFRITRELASGGDRGDNRCRGWPPRYSPRPPALPGGTLTRPIDRRPGGARDNPPPTGMSTVSPDLFLDARSVADPGERALALVRIAQTAIFSRQLDEAHTALFEA